MVGESQKSVSARSKKRMGRAIKGAVTILTFMRRFSRVIIRSKAAPQREGSAGETCQVGKGGRGGGLTAWFLRARATFPARHR